MFEMLVGAFVLMGSVCVDDGDLSRDCRRVPAMTFGNKYACDRQVQAILTGFPSLKPEQLGFPDGQRLRVTVKCSPTLPNV